MSGTARERFRLEIERRPQTFGGYLLRWTWSWVLLPFELRTCAWVKVGPKVDVRIRDRMTGQRMYLKTRRKDDPALYRLISQLRADLRTLDPEAFLSRYRLGISFG
jgi:hypothetical protein